jgi:hypothetical protein
MNARNDRHRDYFTQYATDQLAGQEDLIETSVLPMLPMLPMCCRSRCSAVRRSTSVRASSLGELYLRLLHPPPAALLVQACKPLHTVIRQCSFTAGR